ncbi:MAG: CotH kinase family protein, partial [Bacteroidia bacterium]
MKIILFSAFCLSVFSPLTAQTFTDSNLPLINITTGGQPIIDEPETAMTLSVYQQPNNGRNALTDVPVISNLLIGIELRGSSSQQIMQKKCYGFETWSSFGVETDTSLLGLPAESDWILYASHNDKTFLRNVISFDIYRR